MSYREEDEIERKRIEQEEQMKRETEAMPPLESILPQEPEGDMDVETAQKAEKRLRKKFYFSSVPDVNADSQQQSQEGQQMQLEKLAQSNMAYIFLLFLTILMTLFPS